MKQVQEKPLKENGKLAEDGICGAETGKVTKTGNKEVMSRKRTTKHSLKKEECFTRGPENILKVFERN